MSDTHPISSLKVSPPSDSYVLDQILSGAPLDEVIEKVLGYLRQGN